MLRRILAPVLVASFLLVGCAAEPAATGPYADELKDARRKATSNFERAVFEDYQLTRAEYEEAVNRFVACMRDRGVDAEANADEFGIYDFVWTRTETVDIAQASCERGNTGLIEPLYVGMTRNPGNQNRPDLIARCLVRRSAAPPGYTGRDFEEDMRSQYADAPFNVDDPNYRSCQKNPSAP